MGYHKYKPYIKKNGKLVKNPKQGTYWRGYGMGGFYTDNKGCYIATSVYESYDCPEVWVLRRFRDQYLDSFFLGRAFIAAYYYVSPKVVRIFGNAKLFKRIGRKYLDGLVATLMNKGYSKEPYQD